MVSAVNSVGASGNSNQASATPPAPALTISLVNTVVGGGNRGTLATSQTSSTNMNVSAGNLIVIALGFAGVGDTSTAPTDTAGNTYVECCFTQTNSVATHHLVREKHNCKFVGRYYGSFRFVYRRSSLSLRLNTVARTHRVLLRLRPSAVARPARGLSPAASPRRLRATSTSLR